MKILLTALTCLFAFEIQAIESEKLFENYQIRMVKVKVQAGEEIGLHRDEHPQVVFALKGGTITRLEADGSKTDVQFPTGQTVLRNVDPINEMHRSVNNGSEDIELIIVQLKSTSTLPKTLDDNTHEVAVDIHIQCPMSDELKSFVKSIPENDTTPPTFDEWQSSFVNNMTQLIRLVKSGKVRHSEWSVQTDDRLPIKVNANP